MAFIPSNMYRLSLPPPQISPSITNAPAFYFPSTYAYNAGEDTLSTVMANGYFNPFADFSGTGLGVKLNVGDLVYCVCSDQNATLSVTVTSNPIETEITPINGDAVNTAAIVNGAITTAKIANGAVTTTQISASAGIVGSQLAANTISSASLALNTVQYAKVPMTLANFTGMYAAPFQLIAAQGAGNVIILESLVLEWVYGSAALTLGGAVNAQYGSTVDGGGIICSASIAAADLLGLSASAMEKAAGTLAINSVSAIANTAVYLSNATQAFATGTAGSANIHVWYRVVVS